MQKAFLKLSLSEFFFARSALTVLKFGDGFIDLHELLFVCLPDPLLKMPYTLFHPTVIYKCS